MRLPRLLAAAALALAATAPTLAQEQPVELISSLFVLHRTTLSDGTVTETRDAPDTVLPGDPILVELTYANTGAAPAENFSAVNPIPDGLVFVSTDTAATDYSVDGGKSWGPLASLSVPDGDGKPRAATAADVNQVRFHAPAAVAPGATGTFAFRAVVR